jgi:hypothetical protein
MEPPAHALAPVTAHDLGEGHPPGKPALWVAGPAAWKLLCCNDPGRRHRRRDPFHDLAPRTSLEPREDECVDAAGEAAQELERLERRRARSSSDLESQDGVRTSFARRPGYDRTQSVVCHDHIVGSDSVRNELIASSSAIGVEIVLGGAQTGTRGRGARQHAVQPCGQPS